MPKKNPVRIRPRMQRGKTDFSYGSFSERVLDSFIKLVARGRLIGIAPYGGIVLYPANASSVASFSFVVLLILVLAAVYLACRKYDFAPNGGFRGT